MSISDFTRVFKASYGDLPMITSIASFIHIVFDDEADLPRFRSII